MQTLDEMEKVKRRSSSCEQQVKANVACWLHIDHRDELLNVSVTPRSSLGSLHKAVHPFKQAIHPLRQ